MRAVLAAVDGTKPCCRCGTRKDQSEFRRHKNGCFHSYCRPCEKEYHRNYMRDHPDKQTRYDAYRRSELVRKFGITQADWDELYELQGGVCAICGMPELAKGFRGKKAKVLAVDHDHKTGRVRGLLCQNCNFAISYIERSPHLLERWVSYLADRDS